MRKSHEITEGNAMQLLKLLRAERDLRDRIPYTAYECEAPLVRLRDDELKINDNPGEAEKFVSCFVEEYRHVPEEIERTASPVRSLYRVHGYLACVKADLIPYSRKTEESIKRIIGQSSIGTETRQLALATLEACLWVRFSITSRFEERGVDVHVPSFDFHKSLPAEVLAVNPRDILVSICLPSGERLQKEMSSQDVGEMVHALEPGAELSVRLVGRATLSPENQALNHGRDTDIIGVEDAKEVGYDLWQKVLSVSPETELVESRQTESEDGQEIMPNKAYETYLAHEEDLLRDHAGEYVWIEGDVIKEINPDLDELIEKAKKGGYDPKTSIIRIIEKDPEFLML